MVPLRAIGPALCEVKAGQFIDVACQLDAPGTFHVELFANRRDQGRYSFVGQFEVNNDG